MKIYRYGGFVLLLSILLICVSFYFTEQYNENAIEFELKSPVNKVVFDKIIDEKIPVYELQFQKDYGSYQLIMTTGNSQYFSDNEMESGVRIIGSKDRGIVLGDDVAGEHFRHLDLLGETYEFLGKEYEIIGIEKDSTNIYIPYDDSLASDDWYRIDVKFHIKDIELIPGKYEYIRTQLILNNGQIRTSVMNYEYGLFFVNISLLLISVWILFYIRHWILKLMESFKELNGYYQDQKLRQRLWDIIVKKKRELLIFFFRIGVILMITAVGYFVIKGIHVPKRLVANNIMSVKSWYDLGKFYFDHLAVSIKYGFFNIRRDFVIAFFLTLLLFVRLSHSFELIGKVNREK